MSFRNLLKNKEVLESSFQIEVKVKGNKYVMGISEIS